MTAKVKSRRSLEQMRLLVVFPLLLAVACGVWLAFPDWWVELDDRITRVRYAYRARAPQALGGNDRLAVIRHHGGASIPARDAATNAPSDSFLYSLALCTPTNQRLSLPSQIDVRTRGWRAGPVRVYLERSHGPSRYLQLDPGGDLPTSLQQEAAPNPMGPGLAGGAGHPVWAGDDEALYHDFSLRFTGNTVDIASEEKTGSVHLQGESEFDSLCVAPIVSNGLTVVDEVKVVAPGVGGGSSYRAVGSYRLRPLLHPFDLETKLVGHGLLHLLSSLVILAFVALVTRLLIRSSIDKRRLKIGGGKTVWRTHPTGLMTLPLLILALSSVRAGLGLSLLSLYAVVLAAIAHEWVDSRRFVAQSPDRQDAPGKLPRRTALSVVTALAFVGIVAHAASYRTQWLADLPAVLAALPVVALPLLMLWRTRLDGRAPLLPTLASLAQCALYVPLSIVQPAITPVTFYALLAIPWIGLLCVLGGSSGAPPRLQERLFRGVAVVVALLLVEVALRGDHHLDFVSSPEALASSYADPRMTSTAGMMEAIETRSAGDGTTVELGGSTFDVEKPEDRQRIVCLGSSSTYGAGAETHDGSYPNQLAALMAMGTDDEIEVINGGVGGARLSFLEFYLQHILLPLDPDLVILYFGMNGDSQPVGEGLRRLSDWLESTDDPPTSTEMWAATQLRWPTPRMVRWMDRAVSIRTLGWTLGALNGLRHSGRLDVVSGPGSEQYADAIDRAGRGEGSAWGIVEKCRAQGTPILLVPEIAQAENDEECRADPQTCKHPYYAIFEHLADESASDEVFYGNILPMLPVELREQRMIDSVHLDPQGYGLLAWAIAELIEDEPALLPDP